jgi:hypothetical protein
MSESDWRIVQSYLAEERLSLEELLRAALSEKVVEGPSEEEMKRLEEEVRGLEERFDDFMGRYARFGPRVATLKFDLYSKYTACRTLAMKLNAYEAENAMLKRRLGLPVSVDPAERARGEELVKKYLEPTGYELVPRKPQDGEGRG